MKTLYKTVLLKESVTGEEREFYEKLIDTVILDVPAEIKQADIRNYFEVQFLMKYVDQPEQGEPMPDGEILPENDGVKEDM